MGVTTAPTVTRSMRSALADLDLSEAVVVHAGGDSYRLAGALPKPQNPIPAFVAFLSAI